ncbi:MAG: archaellin/type IV pilin N-terminal domain-containing protein, partial [Candidatus Nanohaloarchaea archaeon]|nr:archaellin/type IV pilin N-terminal domain-containing protein [Candidatus Nanohaloarchaea archaeon]
MSYTDHRQGVTPVVAILIMLMIAVVAGTGAYVWISQFQEESQEKTQEEFEDLDRGIALQSLRCYNEGGSGHLEAWFKNTGQTKLDLDPVDMIIEKANAESANTTLSRPSLSLLNGTLSQDIDIVQGSGDFSSAETSATYEIETSRFQEGISYNVEFIFTAEDEFSVSESCDLF